MEKLINWVDRRLIVLLLVLFIVRSGFLAVSGLGLVGDESYYWDWSRQPDWCYFSKPPMVAWLIAASTLLLGDGTAAVRLPAVVLGSVFLWYFHAAAKAFYGRRAAAFALLLILATPNNVLANLIMTIDPPLYCFWMMSVYYLRKAVFDQQPRAWFWAGCAGGAALLSKQIAVALPLLMLVFIMLDRSRYAWLKREFLFYILPILLATLPIMLWNYQHEWVMFSHSKTHFTSQVSTGVADSLKYVGELFLYQILLISPIIFGLVLYISWHGILSFPRMDSERQFLLLTGPLLLLMVLVLSIAQKVQGNWPMPFYFTALILLSGYWQEGRWRKWPEYGLKLGFLLVATTYMLPVLLQVFHLQNKGIDPTRRFNHWPELVRNIDRERRQLMPNLRNSFVLALGHRYLASQLAFYLPEHPQVFRFEFSGEIKSQYEIWPGPVAFLGGDALVVSDVKTVPENIQSRFEKFSFIAQTPNPTQPSSPYYLFLGEKLKYWSPSARQAIK